MTQRRHDDSLAGQFLSGMYDRRDLMRRAGTLAAMTAGAGAAGGMALAPHAAVMAQGTTSGLLTTNNEQTGTWIRNFNPLLPENASCRWPTLMGMYEPLFLWNTIKGEAVPMLASSWAFSEDNLNLTFVIRQGVKWSDNTPFSAADVVFTWGLLRKFDALPGNGARSVLPDIDAVVASTGQASSATPGASPVASPAASPVAGGEETVTFVFNKVNTVGLYDIANQVIVPEHIWKDVPDPVTFTNENPVGTGPFTEVARFEAQIWELHANPNYWQEGKPQIKGLSLPTFNGNDAINLATVNGELDWTANFIPDIEATFVAKDPENFHYWFPPTGAAVHLYLNTTIAPFDNVDVRKAISMAINREQIVEIAMYGYTHPSDSTGLSDAFEGWKNEAAKSAEWVTYNVDAANAALDAAGLAMDGDVRKTADGTPLEFELNVVSGWSDWVQSCDIMSKNLAEVGIKATVKPFDQATWQAKVQNGDFKMSIGWSSQGATILNFYRGVMSSTTLMPIGESAGENWHRFASSEADALLAQFAATSVEEEQRTIADGLQQLYADNAPAIPLFPGPQWGEFITSRFEGFPSEENPYALLSTYANERTLVLNSLTEKTA